MKILLCKEGGVHSTAKYTTQRLIPVRQNGGIQASPALAAGDVLDCTESKSRCWRPLVCVPPQCYYQTGTKIKVLSIDR